MASAPPWGRPHNPLAIGELDILDDRPADPKSHPHKLPTHTVRLTTTFLFLRSSQTQPGNGVHPLNARSNHPHTRQESRTSPRVTGYRFVSRGENRSFERITSRVSSHPCGAFPAGQTSGRSVGAKGPSVRALSEDFALVDRTQRRDAPHPMRHATVTALPSASNSVRSTTWHSMSAGARRVEIGYETDAAAALYQSVGRLYRRLVHAPISDIMSTSAWIAAMAALLHYPRHWLPTVTFGLQNSTGDGPPRPSVTSTLEISRGTA